MIDTTLRDGTQREGLSVSIEDKLRIARRLDQLGIPSREDGLGRTCCAIFLWQPQEEPLSNAEVVAFAPPVALA